MQRTMIIVGAGMSGLSTGCYAQMNGYKTTLFESHTIPGGLCTAWTRKGYTFDLSMHMLTNSKCGPLKKMWDELEVTRGQEFHYHDNLVVVEGNGKKLDICVDRERLLEQMLAISPADANLSREFADLLCGRGLMDLASVQPPELTNIAGRLKTALSIVPLLGLLRKYSGLSLQDFSARFKEPFLARAVKYSVDSPGWPMPQFPMVAMAGFARSSVTTAGSPMGGSRKITARMADLYKSLGGDIQYNSRVTNLLLKNDKAGGVQLQDGSAHSADIVVWAADGHHLIFEILGGKYLDDNIRNMYDKWLPVKPIVHVMFGVDMDLAKEPSRLVFETDKPITVGRDEFSWLSLMTHCFDKGTAPASKTALEVWYATDYDYWQNIAKDRIAYEAEKARIAEETADALEKRWPGFRSRIEMTDVPTPVTYARYTSNWQGSPDGWYITTENMMKQRMRRTLPGLENLYMVGQWTAPFTGTVMAALSGRQLIQILCRKERRPFITKANVG
ncbi:NAD(P)/FAD-dependent oxidoreductase [candidate division KSB1 bacterium]|nr:NAD(P)/FAD-dependent oxidoreductase [candidate division KSB1 bacterium]RQW09280.1 MAG: NAD(P)/FAD-dependent oxidoreductase [candidate division KSB1 bacterium]